MSHPPLPCTVETTGFGPAMIFGLSQALWTTNLICSLSPPEMWPKDQGQKLLNKYAGQGDRCLGVNCLPFTSKLSNDYPKYDFIVVGAGTAGSVVANRLSENPRWKVLLIEAGGNPPIESEVPALAAALQKTKYDWQYYTDTDTNTKSYCKAQQNKGCYWPRGKMLGGSSAINFMLHVRGIKSDFDEWARLGNSGWDYESVLKHFKKAENNHNSAFVNYKNGKYHSANGPQHVDFFSPDGTEPIQQMLLNAAVEAGHKHIDNINADKVLGYVKIQGTYFNGTRQSSAKAYLIPAMDRPNLHIIKNALAHKVIIRHKKAIGVEFVYKGYEDRLLKVYAEKEVIVSAGAINTPQLLMLSGIGPQEKLKRLGIHVHSNLAVGKNLVDHSLVTMWMKFSPTVVPPSAMVGALEMYANQRIGPFASIGATQMTGFFNSLNRAGSNPDFQVGTFYFVANSTATLQVLLNVLNYDKKTTKILLNENKNHDVAALLPVLLKQKSRGVIELATTSPNDQPIIKPNYFSKQEDMDSYVRAVKQQLELLNTNTFKKRGAQLVNIPIRECARLRSNSDDYHRCYIRHWSGTTYHPAGTAKMGPKKDPEAVVDDKLKVHNIDNLRVIDASVMPTIVSGNINAATQMIGEKGADIIRRYNS